MEPSSRYLYQLAAFKASEHQEAAARLILEEVLRLDPLFAPAWARLGAVLEKGPESLAACRRAVELAPENRSFRHRAGCALALAGDHQAALPLLLSLQAGKATLRMSYNLALAHLHLGDKAAARLVLLSLSPDPQQMDPDEEDIAEALACADELSAALALQDLT